MANLSTTQHDAVNRAETAIKSGASQFMPNAQLILFGSRARGDAHRRSDFDLAFKPQLGSIKTIFILLFRTHLMKKTHVKARKREAIKP